MKKTYCDKCKEEIENSGENVGFVPLRFEDEEFIVAMKVVENKETPAFDGGGIVERKREVDMCIDCAFDLIIKYVKKHQEEKKNE